MSHLTFFYKIGCKSLIGIGWFYKKNCQHVTNKKEDFTYNGKFHQVYGLGYRKDDKWWLNLNQNAVPVGKNNRLWSVKKFQGRFFIWNFLQGLTCYKNGFLYIFWYKFYGPICSFYEMNVLVFYYFSSFRTFFIKKWK